MTIDVKNVDEEGLTQMGFRRLGSKYRLYKPVWTYKGDTTTYIEIVINSAEMICTYNVYDSSGEIYHPYYANTCKSLVNEKILAVYKSLFGQLKKIGVIAKNKKVTYA